jgi:hypothetical protein
MANRKRKPMQVAAKEATISPEEIIEETLDLSRALPIEQAPTDSKYYGDAQKSLLYEKWHVNR